MTYSLSPKPTLNHYGVEEVSFALLDTFLPALEESSGRKTAF